MANRAGETFEINPLQIFGAEFRWAEIEFYFFDRPPEIFREYFGVFEFWNYRETVVGADIHAFVGCEPERNAVLHFQFGLLFAVNEKAGRAAGSKLAGFVGGELVAHVDFACRNGIARTDGVEFQAKQAVGVLEMSVFDIQGKPAKETGFSHDHARDSGAQSKCACPARVIEIGADAVGTIVNWRNHAGRNVFSAVVVNEF